MNNKKAIVILMLISTMVSTLPAYAHKVHLSKTQSAIKELNEVKRRIEKLTPDAEGHVSKASQAVDQALKELSAVKEAPTPNA